MALASDSRNVWSGRVQDYHLQMDEIRTLLVRDIAATQVLFLRMAEAGRERLFWVDTRTALMPGGHNGPYFDLESPVRNSSHWLATMAMAFKLTSDDSFRIAGAGLARYLESTSPSIDGGSVHRQRFPKDWTNGIIGPAWESEGLALAGRHLGLESAAATGAATLRRLGFDEKRGLWRALDPATRSRAIDRTVNHQLYCTAIAAEYPDDPILKERVERFIGVALPNLLRTDDSDILEHHVPETPSQRLKHTAIARARSSVGPALRRAALSPGMVSDAAQRDRGYHLFSLYSAVRIARATDRPDVLSLPAIRRATAALPSLAAEQSYRKNCYTFGYNPPGFELPYVALHGATDPERGLAAAARDALATQLDVSLDTETGLFTHSTGDPLTLAARAFELGLLHA